MSKENPLQILEHILEIATKAGATAADTIYVEGTSTSVTIREGALEDLSRSESADIGVRIYDGERQAIVSTTATDTASLTTAVEQALAMARNSPPDAQARIARAEELFDGPVPDLDLYDGNEPDAEELKRLAKDVEQAALSVKGVSKTDGGSAAYGSGQIALATSNGFKGHYKKSSHSLSVSAIAGEGTHMERDYDYSSCHHKSDLESAEAVGKSAGERTVKRLNPRKMNTCAVPVVFDPRVGNSLLGHFAGAINGRAITRGTSFLKSFMDKPVFNDGITIVDDPLRKRGLASKPFDAEGLQTQALTLVENGVLKTWLLDIAAAEQLGLISNGRAARGTSSRPSPSSSNLYIEAGKDETKDLIRQIKSGFYLTELIGMGVNGVTGDYSRGASGYWIENGEITYPVNEITINSNLKDMYQNMTAGNDLQFRYGTNVPTLFVDGMTVAGS